MKTFKTTFFSVLFILSSSNGAKVTNSCIKGLEKTIQELGCQRYLASGYKFEEFYSIDGLRFDNVVAKKSHGDLVYFEMHLAVKTGAESRLMLSAGAPRGDEINFEIGIGEYMNLYTTLRLSKSRETDTLRISTPFIISPKRYTYFYLIISEDTLIFGREGDSPLMTFPDKSLKYIKYFGMSSADKQEASFLYDCPQTNKLFCYYKSK